ncbi:MAG: hypothetical protein LBB23_04760 [Rickettsiales bacterium]|jgi:hypothetical protein|nr:hypothetical protein [Rickettsiales bacterium]
MVSVNKTLFIILTLHFSLSTLRESHAVSIRLGSVEIPAKTAATAGAIPANSLRMSNSSGALYYVQAIKAITLQSIPASSLRFVNSVGDYYYIRTSTGPCPLGQYQATSGSSTCSDCPNWWVYCPGDGKSYSCLDVQNRSGGTGSGGLMDHCNTAGMYEPVCMTRAFFTGTHGTTAYCAAKPICAAGKGWDGVSTSTCPVTCTTGTFSVGGQGAVCSLCPINNTTACTTTSPGCGGSTPHYDAQTNSCIAPVVLPFTSCKTAGFTGAMFPNAVAGQCLPPLNTWANCACNWNECIIQTLADGSPACFSLGNVAATEQACQGRSQDVPITHQMCGYQIPIR